jgi:hypothetical protein
VYKTLIFTLILVFLTSNSSFAVPIESPPEQDIHSGDVAAGNPVQAVAAAKIPDSSVEMFLRNGSNSRFEIFFLDIRYGYDLVDFEFYNAWCLEEGKPIRRNAIHKVRLYNCYDPDIPAEFGSMDWNRINYIVNHKNVSPKVTQEAIWHFARSGKKPLSAQAAKLVEEANLNGKDYKPAEGELMAVICQPKEKKQPLFLEFKIPKVNPVEVSSMAVEPVLSVSKFPIWLPLIGLLGIIPFIHSQPHHPPPHPPPPPPPVPEPSSLLLLGCGVAGLIVYRKIRKKRNR